MLDDTKQLNITLEDRSMSIFIHRSGAMTLYLTMGDMQLRIPQTIESATWLRDQLAVALDTVKENAK